MAAAAALLRIDLMPEEARKVAPSAMQQFHRTPLMALAAAIMVAVPLLLLLPISLKRRQLAALRTQIAALEPRRAELERIQQFLQRLRSQQAAFQGLRKGQDIWSTRLNTLSNVTPDGLWFTDLTLDHKKGMVLQGSAIATSGPEMVTVTRLVQALKSDPEFSQTFRSIQIESIKRVQEGSFDLVQFTVTCMFTPAPS
jgi:Tfp pilus assembly protein PilN